MDARGNIYLSEQVVEQDATRLRETYTEASEDERADLERRMIALRDEVSALSAVQVLREHAAGEER